jgi:hypothetical protein
LTAAATEGGQQRRNRSFKILEVFTWTMALSLTAASHGWDVLEPVTLDSGWDLRRAEDRKKALSYVARERPDLVVTAWPCTAFSPMQNLMKNWPGHEEKLKQKD